MIRQFELVERVQSYDPDADEDMLNRAYVYGLKKHGNQLRASGDPYFSHPVEVAGIDQLGVAVDEVIDCLRTDTHVKGMIAEQLLRWSCLSKIPR